MKTLESTTTLTATETEALSSLETVIERNVTSFVEAGNALAEIRESKLYRDTDGNFEAYCVRRWNFTGRYARNLMESAKVVERLKGEDGVTKRDAKCEDGTESGTIVPVPESEALAREVAKAPPEKQAKAWKRAVRTAPKGTDGKPKVTAAHVKLVVEEVVKPPVPERQAPTDEVGNELPDRKDVRDAFESRPTFTDLMNRLSRIKADANGLGDAAAYLHRQQFDADVRNAREALKFARPHALCPYCKGKKNKCDACKGLGWVPSQTYENAPKELKSGGAQ